MKKICMMFFALAVSTCGFTIGLNRLVYQGFPGDNLEIPSRSDVPDWTNGHWWRIFNDIRVGDLGIYCPLAKSFLNDDSTFVIAVGYYYNHPDLSSLPRGFQRLQVALEKAREYGPCLE